MSEVKIMDLNKYHVEWRKNGSINWKKGAKKYPEITLDKIILDGDYKIDDELLAVAKEHYQTYGKMLPVYLTYGMVLKYGYTFYAFAKELGLDRIPFQRPTNIKKLSKKERREFIRSKPSRAIGNKKYAFTAIDGTERYFSAQQMEWIKKTKQLCKKLHYRLILWTDNYFILLNDKQKELTKSMSIQKILKYCSNQYDNICKNKNE